MNDAQREKTMNVKDIVKKYLEFFEYDGLAGKCYNEGCGCGLNDLMPCENASPDCVPAKRFKCSQSDCPMPSSCVAFGEEYNGWCYRPIKVD